MTLTRTTWAWRRARALLACLSLVMAACGGKLHKKGKTSGETPAIDPMATEGPCRADATTPTRTIGNDCYGSVGMVTNNGSLLCSGLILRHGVFATAKHCYRDDKPVAPDFSGVGIVFTGTNGIVEESSLTITGTDVKDLRFDGNGNDLAYIIYDAAVTKGKVALDTTNIIRTIPETGTLLNVVGYPSPRDGIDRKLVTSPCHRTSREGAIGAKPLDAGYDGTLYDTDCGAWFGNSGGPFFVMDADDPTAIKGVVGVVTHTFDTDAQGNITDGAMANDAFGSYVKTVNFSPFKQAISLDAALAEGEG